jgi:hypothetical protein
MMVKALDWRRRRAWLASMRQFAAHLLSAEVRRHVAQTRPECWSDDLSWLPDADSLLPELVRALKRHYTHYKGFHGCRPLRVQSYYEQGLVGQNGALLVQAFREIYSDVPPEQLDRAIEVFSDRAAKEQGKVWLVGTEEFLVRACGHYMIQGSEMLMSLAARLGPSPSGEDYRFRLRRYGVPTILEVDVPVALIPPAQHFEVARTMLSEWGQLAARRPLRMGSIPPCYVVSEPIPPQCIVSHQHPARIYDPHQGRRVFTNTQLSCDVCG